MPAGVSDVISKAQAVAREAKKRREKASKKAGTERRSNESKGSFIPSLKRTKKDFLDEET